MNQFNEISASGEKTCEIAQPRLQFQLKFPGGKTTDRRQQRGCIKGPEMRIALWIVGYLVAGFLMRTCMIMYDGYKNIAVGLGMETLLALVFWSGYKITARPSIVKKPRAREAVANASAHQHQKAAKRSQQVNSDPPKPDPNIAAVVFACKIARQLAAEVEKGELYPEAMDVDTWTPAMNITFLALMRDAVPGIDEPCLTLALAALRNTLHEEGQKRGRR